VFPIVREDAWVEVPVEKMGNANASQDGLEWTVVLTHIKRKPEIILGYAYRG